MTEQHLASLFHRLLAAGAIAAPVAFSAACGGRTGDGQTMAPGTPDASDDEGGTDGATPSPEAGCTPIMSGPGPCGSIATLPCGLPGVYPTPGMTLPPSECQTICGPTFTFCAVTSVDHVSGETVVQCGGCVTGRRPAGLEAPQRTDAAVPLGAYFAECARLEAASVTAFDFLAAELASHGAPRALARRAERAARDEVKHAVVMRALAARWGAAVEESAVSGPVERSLEDLARENAVEGCVRETFGALLATLQGRAAKDRVVGAVLRRIARDETRHAALAWAVSAWAEPRLDPAARARVREARRAAVRELRHEASREPHESLASVAGMPRAPRARALVDAMETALWS
jgi:hypothetical protein